MSTDKTLLEYIEYDFIPYSTDKRRRAEVKEVVKMAGDNRLQLTIILGGTADNKITFSAKFTHPSSGFTDRYKVILRPSFGRRKYAVKVQEGSSRFDMHALLENHIRKILNHVRPNTSRD